MPFAGILGFLLIIINVLVSYKGMKNRAFFDGYKFEVDPVLKGRDYKRLVTSGFLHVSWMHLIFNMIALFMFSPALEFVFGAVGYLVIYFGSLVCGKLLALLIHRNHGDYSSAGASGAIAGLMFAFIAVDPYSSLGLFFIPLPAWIWGILYMIFSMYAIRSRRDNIGHESHLGGAITGMLLAMAMRPQVLVQNYLVILLIAVPAIVFIVVIIRKPYMFLIDNQFFKTHQHFYSIDHKYNAERARKQQEIDRLLDKISKRGMGSLSRQEKEMLEAYSKQVR